MTAPTPDPAPLPAGAYVYAQDGNGFLVKDPVRVVTWEELAAALDPPATPNQRSGEGPSPLAWAEDSIREFGTNPGVHPLAHPVASTIQGLIIQATNAKVQALAWQQRIARNCGAQSPHSQSHAQECADWWQKRLVHLLTLIIAGDEATLASEDSKP